MLKFWIAAYVLMLVAIVAGLFALRASVLAEMSTPAAEADWMRWKAEAAKEDGTAGPVQRTVPKSNEPPLLILMRDYFRASVVGLLLPVSALYWFIAWLVHGVATQSAEARLRSPPGEAR
jgi:hypothetical protein